MNEDLLRNVQLQNVRLECLKLAIVGNHDKSTEVIMTRANELMNFITNGKEA
jgi:hypothetical protein